MWRSLLLSCLQEKRGCVCKVNTHAPAPVNLIFRSSICAADRMFSLLLHGEWKLTPEEGRGIIYLRMAPWYALSPYPTSRARPRCLGDRASAAAAMSGPRAGSQEPRAPRSPGRPSAAQVPAAGRAGPCSGAGSSPAGPSEPSEAGPCSEQFWKNAFPVSRSFLLAVSAEGDRQYGWLETALTSCLFDFKFIVIIF